MTGRWVSLNAVRAVRMADWRLTDHHLYIVSGIQIRIQEGRGDFYPEVKAARPEATNQLHFMPRLKHVEVYLHFPIAPDSVQCSQLNTVSTVPLSFHLIMIILKQLCYKTSSWAKLR